MKIYKDEHQIDVSPNAYEIMYKRLGYEKVVKKKVDPIFDNPKSNTELENSVDTNSNKNNKNNSK